MRAVARLLPIVLLVGVASCTDDYKEPAASTVPSTPETAAPAPPLDIADLTGTWRDEDGKAVPPTTDALVFDIGPGSEHCFPQNVLFLTVTEPFGTPATTLDDGRVFIRDPERTLVGPPWDSIPGVDLNSELPKTARFTGFSTGDIELWVDQDEQHAFLTDGQTVERWPRVDPPPLCA